MNGIDPLLIVICCSFGLFLMLIIGPIRRALFRDMFGGFGSHTTGYRLERRDRNGYWEVVRSGMQYNTAISELRDHGLRFPQPFRVVDSSNNAIVDMV
jgi:hypothetical protein